jgi:hypothetical protein
MSKLQYRRAQLTLSPFMREVALWKVCLAEDEIIGGVLRAIGAGAKPAINAMRGARDDPSEAFLQQ